MVKTSEHKSRERATMGAGTERRQVRCVSMTPATGLHAGARMERGQADAQCARFPRRALIERARLWASRGRCACRYVEHRRRLLQLRS